MRRTIKKWQAGSESKSYHEQLFGFSGMTKNEGCKFKRGVDEGQRHRRGVAPPRAAFVTTMKRIRGDKMHAQMQRLKTGATKEKRGPLWSHIVRGKRRRQAM